MIGTNLATRPFYNERAARACIIALGVLVASATIYNGAQVLRYGRNDSSLGAQASRDEQRAAELRSSAARLRASVNVKDAEASTTRVRAANALIDRRVFSWTELLSRLEKTLPDNARITAIKPKTEAGRTVLALSVLARGVDDVNRFMENLEASGAFTRILARAERVTDAGQLEVSLEATYLAAAATPEPDKTVAAAGAARTP